MRRLSTALLILAVGVFSAEALPTRYQIQADTTTIMAGDLLQVLGRADIDSAQIDTLYGTMVMPGGSSLTVNGSATIDSLTVVGPLSVDTLTSTSLAILDTVRADSLTMVAGKKAFISRVSSDTVNTDSLTLSASGKATFLPGSASAFQAGATMSAAAIDADTINADSISLSHTGKLNAPPGTSVTVAAIDADTLLGAVRATGLVTAAAGLTAPAGQTVTAGAVDADTLAGALRTTGLVTAAAGITVPAGQTATAGAADVDTLKNGVRIEGTAAFTGPVTSALAPVFSGGATASSMNITGKTTLGDAAGDTTISKKTRAVSLHVGGTTDPDSAAQVTGGGHIAGGLKVDGASTLTGVTTMNGGSYVRGGNLWVGHDGAIDVGYQRSVTISSNRSSGSGEIPSFVEFLNSASYTTTDVGAGMIQVTRVSPDIVFSTGSASLGGGNVIGARSYTEAWRIKNNGDLIPGADATQSFGSTAASLDSAYIMDVVTGADIPFLDDVDDVAEIRAIRGSGQYDARGRELVDDWTLPKSIMLIYTEDQTDTVVTNVVTKVDTVAWDTTRTEVEVADSTVVEGYTVTVDSLGVATDADPVYAKITVIEELAKPVTETCVVSADTTLVPHAAGDLVLTASGKPMYSLSPAIGQLQGAIRQLAATDDSLRARIEALEGQNADILTRLAKLEGR